MAHNDDLLPAATPRSDLNSEDAQSVVPRYASCTSSQAWLDHDPSQPPTPLLALPESSPSTSATHASLHGSLSSLNHPARHLSNDSFALNHPARHLSSDSFASTATSSTTDDNLNSVSSLSHLLVGTSISLSHLTLSTLDLANQPSTSRNLSPSASLPAPGLSVPHHAHTRSITPSTASSTPTSERDTGYTTSRGPSFELPQTGGSSGLTGGITAGGVADPGHDQAVSPFLFNAGGQRLDGSHLNGDFGTLRPAPSAGRRQGSTGSGGLVGTSPFATMYVGPEFDDSNVTVVEAKPVLNSLSSRPSYPIQELGPTLSKKLPSFAMKVGKEWNYLTSFNLNALLLCCQPGAESNLFLLLAINKELMVHNVQEKASRTQVLSSEVRAVAHRNDVTWVGMANGFLEVEKKGMKLELQAFQCAVSSIALDDEGNAWVGSEHGGLRVLEPFSNAQGDLVELREHKICRPDGARVRGIRLEDPRVKGSMHHSSASNKITAMCSVGHHIVLAKGDGDSAIIQLWRNQQDHRQLEDINLCGQDQYKACTYLTSIPWHRQSHRILTGHSKGAVLLWNRHDEGKLSPAIMIDVPVAMNVPIRGLVHIPAVNALCVGAGKQLHFLLLPTPSSLAELPQNRIWWQVKPLTVTAHRASVKMMAGTSNGHVITVSGWGKLRLWYEENICKALKQANIAGLDTSGSIRPSPDREPGQRISYTELKFKRRVGQGSYGTVYEAEWNRMPVAVKTLHHFDPEEGQQGVSVYNPNLQQFTRTASSGLPAAEGSMGDVSVQMKELHREMHNLLGLGHANVVRLYGLVLDHPSGPMIVTEFCKGNVNQIIQKAQECVSPSWRLRTEVLEDVARGMLYLHSRLNPVVHGDLRSPNLLLDNRGVAKIADFGSARAMLANINAVELSKTCNPRWAAPEKLQHRQDSLAADVWAYGIVMYELATMKRPYYTITHDYAVYEEVKKGVKPVIPADLDLSQVPGGYMDLMSRCLATSPADRPAFEVIYETMKSIKSAT